MVLRLRAAPTIIVTVYTHKLEGDSVHADDFGADDAVSLVDEDAEPPGLDAGDPAGDPAEADDGEGVVAGGDGGDAIGDVDDDGVEAAGPVDDGAIVGAAEPPGGLLIGDDPAGDPPGAMDGGLPNGDGVVGDPPGAMDGGLPNGDGAVGDPPGV